MKNSHHPDKSPAPKDRYDDQQALTVPQVNQIVEHLDQAEQQLDYVTTSRLAAIRHQTLDHAAKQAQKPQWQQWLLGQSPIAGSVAAFALVAVVASSLWLNQGAGLSTTGIDTTTPGIASLDTTDADFSILIASDDLDFFQSLEFLESLEDEDLG